MEAARRTPSSMNRQAWDFVVVTDPIDLRRLAGVWRYADHVATSDATVALVAPVSHDVEDRETAQFDLGQASMSIMLAAADLGIGSCQAAVEDQALAREILGLPETQECMWLLSLGWPAARPLTPIERPDRRSFDDVVHRGRW